MWEKIPITLCSPEKLPIARESHSSVLIKNSLFVIGGLDDKENSISDSWLFNLSNYTWSKVHLLFVLSTTCKKNNVPMFMTIQILDVVSES